MATPKTKSTKTGTETKSNATVKKTTATAATKAKSKTAPKATAPKSSAKTAKAPVKSAAGKRELINTGTDKRYVRRDGGGQFKESDDVGKSLAADRRQKAQTKAKPGQGDKGDR